MASSGHWIEYVDDWRDVPMAYWVHIEQGEAPWRNAEKYKPAAPPPIPHKGYPVVCVPFEDSILRFSSEAQLRECIRVLAMVTLPTSRKLSLARGADAGPNSHWLSRLPAKLKSPGKRARLVRVQSQVASDAAAPNPSIERTASSALRPLEAAAHVKR
jgi:hypothetical protein